MLYENICFNCNYHSSKEMSCKCGLNQTGPELKKEVDRLQEFLYMVKKAEDFLDFVEIQMEYESYLKEGNYGKRRETNGK